MSIVNSPANVHPRDPPPSPDDPFFPEIPAERQVPRAYTAAGLRVLLSRITKKGPSIAHLDALNVQIHEDVGLNALIPYGYLPATEGIDSNQKSHCQERSHRETGCGSVDRSSFPTKMFYERAADLAFDNEDVFRYLEGRPTLSGRSIKVTWFRKFWQSLLMVAQYWDTSTDGLLTDPDPQSGKTYMGRRIYKGGCMPLFYLENVLKEFFDAFTPALRCRFHPPKAPRKVEIGHLRVPTAPIGTLWRTPSDRNEARSGLLEGPVLGALVMEKPSPSDPNGSAPTDSALVQVRMILKEISLAISIAQDRAREGHHEVLDHKGQWWSNAPRWGGGPGEQIGVLKQPLDRSPDYSDQGNKRRRRQITVEKHESLLPAASTWDKNVRYQQIGKGKGIDTDDVSPIVELWFRWADRYSHKIFIVSVMNHHLSVIRLQVSDVYLQNLSLGSDDLLDPPLVFQRSPWFDLLTPDGRLQAMRVVWGALAWITRNDT